MSNHEHAQPHAHGSTAQYITGYLLSLVLTVIPLALVLTHSLSRDGLILTILTTAVLQFIVQLFLFMHVREKQNGTPHWHGIGLVLGLVVILTIVCGSIWVMKFSSQVQ
jgi:cytochrome o ubiquinol oxidase operon protein cyoD